MLYDAVLLDADDTIFDFRRAEQNAIGEILGALNLDDPAAPKVYHEINRACWASFERGEISQKELRVKRFADFLRRYKRGEDPAKMSEHFIDALSRQSALIDGALETVAAIAKVLPVAIVTNGIAKVQHRRLALSPVKPLISAVVISEEVGFPKPNPCMIHTALEKLGGVPAHRALMVGDSLTSDIACANNAFVDACWYNPLSVPLQKGYCVRYVLNDIRRLPEIALSAA